MKPELSEQEKQFVDTLLTWDRKDRPLQRILLHFFLILGSVVFIAASVLMLQNMSDRTVVWVMVPGTLMAILFIVIYTAEKRRLRERRLIVSILKKLRGEA